MAKREKRKNTSAATITANGLRDTTSTIIGYDNKDRLVVLNGQGIDGSVRSILFGYPKCGKSQAFLTPYLVQALRRGENCIVGDDGDLYEATAESFRSAGYRVRHLNFCDLADSDTCNLMQYIKDATTIQELQHRIEIFACSLVTTAMEDRWSNAVIEAFTTLLVAVTMRVVLDPDLPSTLCEVASVLEQGGAYIDNMLDSKKIGGVVRAALPIYERFLRQVRTWHSFNLNILVQILQRVKRDDLKSAIDTAEHNTGIPQPGQEHQVIFVSAPMKDPILRGYAAAYLALSMDQSQSGALGGTTSANIILDNAGDMGYYAGLPDFLSRLTEPDNPGHDCVAAVLTFRNKAQIDHLYGTETDTMLDAANLLVGCGINDADTAALFINSAGDAKKRLFGRREKVGLQERDLYSAGASHTFAVVNGYPAVDCRQFGAKQEDLQNF